MKAVALVEAWPLQWPCKRRRPLAAAYTSPVPPSRNAFDIRPATRDDLPGVAKLAALMVRLHHGWDAQRFAVLSEPIEPGYEAWLGHELDNKKAVVLVAVARPQRAKRNAAAANVLGYAYARLEGRDWNRLLDACGLLHDLVVAEDARRAGVASALLEAVSAWMHERGAPRLILETAAANETAQAFFRKRGFRPTMIEMTRELAGGRGVFAGGAHPTNGAASSPPHVG